MLEFEFEFGEFSRHFRNPNSPNIREFEYEFELGDFFLTPDSNREADSWFSDDLGTFAPFGDFSPSHCLVCKPVGRRRYDTL
jgi:hypothetical protein